MTNQRLRLTPNEINLIKSIRAEQASTKSQQNITGESQRSVVQVIGDTHLPYEKAGYLEFCKEQADKYHATDIIHIGDIIDFSAISRFNINPNLLSAKSELDITKEKIQLWYKIFPKMKICWGNHDLRVQKRLQLSGINQEWLRTMNEIIGVSVDDWQFADSFIIDGVKYTHGIGNSGDKAALNRALNQNISIVSGHQHTLATLQYVGDIFALIVGCGIDDTALAFSYSKDYIKKSIISCAIIIDGKLPILIKM